MANTLQESLARRPRGQLLLLVGLLILLIFPIPATADVIWEDDFEDGLLAPVYYSDQAMWASEGYLAADPSTHSNPSLLPDEIPFNLDLLEQAIFERIDDPPGKLQTGVRGFLTLRPDPGSPPGCDPFRGGDCTEPCDPTTQECYERANG